MLLVWKGVLLSVRSKSLLFTPPIPMTLARTTMVVIAKTITTFRVSLDLMVTFSSLGTTLTVAKSLPALADTPIIGIWTHLLK